MQLLRAKGLGPGLIATPDGRHGGVTIICSQRRGSGDGQRGEVMGSFTVCSPGWTGSQQSLWCNHHHLHLLLVLWARQRTSPLQQGLALPLFHPFSPPLYVCVCVVCVKYNQKRRGPYRERIPYPFLPLYLPPSLSLLSFSLCLCTCVYVCVCVSQSVCVCVCVCV
jgi:hypothetical protein